jgi:hypothetical protein
MDAKFVICIDNGDYPVSLTLHKVYKVIPDARGEALGDVRIIDDSGEAYFFDQGYFMPLPLPTAVAKSFDLAIA